MAKDDDSSKREGISAAPEAAADLELAAYAENDDVVTQFVETRRPPASWIVQLTPFDRRVMSTEQLLAELERGRFVRADTLVWRKGMSEWRSVANVGLTHLCAARTRPMPSVRPRQLGLHWPALDFGSIALLSSLALALYVLWVMSLFDSGARGVSPPALHRQTAAESR
jgi:hypothetical protein